MSNAVFCIASTYPQAEKIVNDLQLSGFAQNDISVLFPDKEGTRDFAHEKHTKAPEGALAGAGAGGVVGGAIGLLAGVGLLAIPGLGPLIAAGPIMASLSGIAAGAAVGSIAGALVGMGIPEIQAKQYEEKVRSGNILISAHCADAKCEKRAKEVYEANRATDITTASESKAPKPKKAKV